MGQLFKNFRAHRLPLILFKFNKILFAAVEDLFPISNVEQQVKLIERKNEHINRIPENGSWQRKVSKLYSREIRDMPS